MKVDLPRIVLLALALRGLWIAVCPNQPTSDTFMYHDLAVHIAAGQGFIDQYGQAQGWWPVGYPMILAFFYRLIAPGPTVAHLANVVLGLMTVMGVHRLARDLFGERAGLAAALAVAVYPTLILYTTCIAAENAVLPAVAWLAWMFARIGSSVRPRWGLTAAAGLLLGAATYIRPTMLLLLLGLPALGLLRKGRVPRWHPVHVLGRAAVVGAVALLLLVPWGVRNQHLFGKFSLVSLNAGANLWMGNHPGATGGYVPFPKELEALPLVDREAEFTRRAVDFIVQNPGEYLLLIAKRIWVTLRSDTIAVAWNAVGIERTLGAGAAFPLMVLCTLGYYLVVGAMLWVVIERRRRRWMSWRDHYLAMMLVLLAAPFVFIVGGNRYHLPLLPLMAVWTSAGLVVEGDAAGADPL